MSPPAGPARMLDPQVRARLLTAKLRGLVRRQWNEELSEPPEAVGTSLAGRSGTRAWALLDDEDDPHVAFGRVLLWGIHRRLDRLDVLADAAPDVLSALARRAAGFRTPVTVWHVTSAATTEVFATPLPLEPPVPPEASAFADVLVNADAVPVAEWGVLSGEVLGLQVAEVIEEKGDYRLEFGISRHDRMINRMVHGDTPSASALTETVTAARAARASGNLHHPLNQLGRERWLRRMVLSRPEQAGLSDARPVSPPVPQTNPRQRLIAPLLAERAGQPLLVACTVGFDPTAVPMLAELASGPVALALPENDRHPLVLEALADLRMPGEVLPVPANWFR